MAIAPSIGYTWLAAKFLLSANPTSIVDVVEIVMIIGIEIVCVLMLYRVYRAKKLLITSAKQLINDEKRFRNDLH